VKGTVLFLHGIFSGPSWMAVKAEQLSAEGFRTVVVSLRGYEGSGGEYRTFGAIERVDISSVLDELDCAGLLEGNVGIWGISMGGAIAIQCAGHDPRIQSVVALAPFRSLHAAAPDFFHTVLPRERLITERDHHHFIEDAGRIAEFSPSDVDVEAALRSTNASVLIVHGTDDLIVPVEHSQHLQQHTNPYSTVRIVAGYGHYGLWTDRCGEIEEMTHNWFTRTLCNQAHTHASPRHP